MLTPEHRILLQILKGHPANPRAHQILFVDFSSTSSSAPIHLNMRISINHYLQTNSSRISAYHSHSS